MRKELLILADKRMFSLKVIDSDKFLDMPISAQALYFHLGMRADDDGFIDNTRKIINMCNCSPDDLKLLVAKNLLIQFENGVYVVTDWKVCNYIQKDRYKPTLFYKEKELLTITENKQYRLKDYNTSQAGTDGCSAGQSLTGTDWCPVEQSDSAGADWCSAEPNNGCIQDGYKVDTEWIQNVDEVDTRWIQNGYSAETPVNKPVSSLYPNRIQDGYKMDTQYSIDKISLDKISIDNIYNAAESTELSSGNSIDNIYISLDDIKKYCKEQNIIIDYTKFYEKYITKPISDWKSAIRSWYKQDLKNDYSKAANATEADCITKYKDLFGEYNGADKVYLETFMGLVDTSVFYAVMADASRMSESNKTIKKIITQQVIKLNSLRIKTYSDYLQYKNK